MCVFCLKDYKVKDFRLIDQKWGASPDLGTPGGEVNYSFATQNFDSQFGAFDAFIIDTLFQNEISNALASWEEVSNIRFIQTPDTSTVDIRFGWRDIDGDGGILGQTTLPTIGSLDRVIVAMDLSENWFVRGDAPPDMIDFSSTVLHEIGHAIGIDHSASTQAIMNASYSTIIFELQQDDIDAATAIYGTNDVIKIDVQRFFNPLNGGHFFTSDNAEKIAVDERKQFVNEGVGFMAVVNSISETIPVHRFFNLNTGGHFFTGFDLEKEVVMDNVDFVYEGIAFRAFSTDSSATVPIFRFFNAKTGGHLFTASEGEKDAIMVLPDFRYEGEAFFAYMS